VGYVAEPIKIIKNKKIVFSMLVSKD